MATEEETRNSLEVRDLMTRAASGVDPEETTPWEQVARRQIDSADLLRFEGYVTEIFTAFGLQLDTPGTRRTPTRFLKALYDATAGYEGDHKLMTVFPAAFVASNISAVLAAVTLNVQLSKMTVPVDVVENLPSTRLIVWLQLESLIEPDPAST